MVKKYVRRTRRRTVRSEASEQKEVVVELRRLQATSGGRVRFFAVPNGGSRHRLEGVHLKGAGVVAGVPDLLILGRALAGQVEPLDAVEMALVRRGVVGEPPDSLVRRLLATIDARSGVALEMKRTDGRETHVTDIQREWLEWFSTTMGWESIVGYGAADALRKLNMAGYAVRTTVPDEEA